MSVVTKSIKLAVLTGSILSVMSAFAQSQSDSTPVVKLEPIVVSVSGVGRTLEKGAGSITAINADEMRQIGAGNMAQIVKYQPLVSAPSATTGSGNVWDSSGVTGYNIRGMDGNRVGLDVDGVELPDAGSRPDGMANNRYGIGRDYIDPETLREVRIQAGSTDARTDGLAGRVSFLTKSPKSYVDADKAFAWGYKTGYADVDKSRQHALHVAMGNDKAKMLLVYSRRDGKEVQANTQVALDKLDWYSNSALLRAEYTPNDNHEFGATVDFYHKDSTLLFDAQSVQSMGGRGSLYPRGGVQKSDVERVRYGLDHIYTPQSNALFDRLSTQVFYQTAKNASITDAYYATVNGWRTIDTALNTDVYGLKMLADKVVATDKWTHYLQYGVDISQTDEKRPWKQVQTNSAGVATITKNNRMPSMQTDKFALHISDKIQTQLAQRMLTIAPQLRFVYQEHKPTDLTNYLSQSPLSASLATKEMVKTTNRYLSPGLMVAYQFTPDVLGYTKYNRSARLPTSGEKVGSYDGGRMYAVVGNPNLKAETSDAFEVGLKGELARGVEFALSGFYNKYQDYIDYRSADDGPVGYRMFFRTQNIADVDIWGGELGVKVDLGEFISHSDGFSMVLGAGVSDYKAKDDLGKTATIDTILPAKATLGFSYDEPNKKFGVGLTSTFVAGKRSDANAGLYRARGYHVQDLTGYWNVTPNVRLNIGVNNIFNQKYWDYSTVSGLSARDVIKIERATAPQRNVMASVEFDF